MLFVPSKSIIGWAPKTFHRLYDLLRTWSPFIEILHLICHLMNLLLRYWHSFELLLSNKSSEFTSSHLKVTSLRNCVCRPFCQFTILTIIWTTRLSTDITDEKTISVSLFFGSHRVITRIDHFSSKGLCSCRTYLFFCDKWWLIRVKSLD